MTTGICHCDICGKTTYLSPPTEMVFKTIKDENGVEYKVPETSKIRRENPHTKKMETLDVPKMKDLEPRSYLVQLHVGQTEYIQRDFCFECLEKIKKDVKGFWDFLENIKPRD